MTHDLAVRRAHWCSGRAPCDLGMVALAMSMTQPICDDCWDKQHPDHPSPRRSAGPSEVCCYCGLDTVSGIYIRVDPKTVPYPSED